MDIVRESAPKTDSGMIAHGGCMDIVRESAQKTDSGMIAHGGCMDIIRQSALKADSGTDKNPSSNWGPKPESGKRMAFQLDAVPSELSLPSVPGTAAKA